MPVKLPVRLQTSDMPGFTPVDLPFVGGAAPTPPDGPVLLCPYPLDASEAEVQAAFGGVWAGKPTMSDGDQTASYTIQGGLLSAERYTAGPAGFSTQTGAILGAPAGKSAVELQVISLPQVADGVIEIHMVLATPDLATLLEVVVDAEGDGTYRIRSDSSFPSGSLLAGLTEPPDNVAIVYDRGAGQAYIRYNGTNYDTISMAATDLIVLTTITETSGVTTGAGAPVSWRVETNAANFIGSYEPGTTDPCGNVI